MVTTVPEKDGEKRNQGMKSTVKVNERRREKVGRKLKEKKRIRNGRKTE